MKLLLSTVLLFTALGTAVMAQDAATEELKLELPKPKLDGTPVSVRVPNLEKPTERQPLMVPAGVTNLASGKPVTSSDTAPVIGDVSFLTDGDKGSDEGYYVELESGSQWVQIDLEKEATIYAILLWHFHSQHRAYNDVIVQLSNDPDFIDGVTTVFNNDVDNSSGLGIGKDMAYVDTHLGKLIPVDGIKAQFVRFYSSGNTANEFNHYIEAEIFGKE